MITLAIIGGTLYVLGIAYWFLVATIYNGYNDPWWKNLALASLWGFAPLYAVGHWFRKWIIP